MWAVFGIAKLGRTKGEANDKCDGYVDVKVEMVRIRRECE